MKADETPSHLQRKEVGSPRAWLHVVGVSMLATIVISVLAAGCGSAEMAISSPSATQAAPAVATTSEPAEATTSTLSRSEALHERIQQERAEREAAEGTASTVVETSTTATVANNIPTNHKLAWGETAEVDGLEITAKNPVSDIATDSEPHRAVWSVEVTIRNASARAPQSYNLLTFQLEDSQGNRYSWGDNYPFVMVENMLDSGTVALGEAVQGRVPFELPEGAEPVALVYAFPDPASTSSIDYFEDLAIWSY